jgi:hypothetical protein
MSKSTRRIMSTLSPAFRQIASEVGVSYDTVKGWSAGRADPSPRNRAALARFARDQAAKLVRLAEEFGGVSRWIVRAGVDGVDKEPVVYDGPSESGSTTIVTSYGDMYQGIGASPAESFRAAMARRNASLPAFVELLDDLRALRGRRGLGGGFPDREAFAIPERMIRAARSALGSARVPVGVTSVDPTMLDHWITELEYATSPDRERRFRALDLEGVPVLFFVRESGGTGGASAVEAGGGSPTARVLVGRSSTWVATLEDPAARELCGDYSNEELGRLWIACAPRESTAAPFC